MLLNENGTLGEDRWRHLEDDEALPEEPAITVSLARWQKTRDALRAHNGKLGLRLPNNAAPQDIAADLDRLDLIVLNFPKFTDGRAYSQAQLLRKRHGYKGELRATGDVLRDQLLFMRRSGFNSFVVGERAVAENWSNAFGEVDVFYQNAADGTPWVMRQRLAKPN